MGFVRFIMAIGILSLTLMAAATPKSPTIQDSSCTISRDNSEEGYRFTDIVNMNKGKCVNTSIYRPIRNFTAQADKISFENYMNDNRFWKADLSLKAGDVLDVYFHVVRFPVLEGVSAAHTQIRFVMNGDLIHLKRENENLNLNDILISFEAALPKGESYNFALGAFDAYGLVARVMSTKQKLAQASNMIEQYKLKLTAAQKVALLKNSLARAHEIGISSFYNTLRPNCTTEVLDLIDTVINPDGKLPPFLTVLSTDPVAGPSLEALRNRGILDLRVQDFNDEVKGIYKNLPIPEPNSVPNPILPRIPGFPWSLVLVVPEESELSGTEREVIAELKSQVLLALPDLIQAYASTLLLKDQKEIAKALLIKTLQTALGRLPEALRRLDGRMPEGQRRIHAYFVPQSDQLPAGDLNDLGIPARLPIPFQEYSLRENDRKAADIFSNLNLGVQKATQKGPAELKKAFIVGATISIFLQKNNSRIVTQVAAGLEQGQYPVSVRNSQVEISNLKIPGTDPQLGRVLSIVTHVQDVRDKNVNPNVTLNFGPWGGIAGQLGAFGFGTFQTFDPSVTCNQNSGLSPILSGNFSSSPTGWSAVDSALIGRPVDFHLLRLEADLIRQSVSQPEVRVSTIGLKCLEIDQVERQFGQNMTDMLRATLKEVKPEDLLNRVTPFF